mgnify:CR=1 FL=1
MPGQEIPPEEIVEVGAVVNEIVDFLKKKGVKFDLSYEKGPEARIEIKGDLNYDDLDEYLRSRNMYNVNRSLNQTANYIGYEAGFGTEEWEREIDLDNKVKLFADYYYENDKSYVTSIWVVAYHYYKNL